MQLIKDFLKAHNNICILLKEGANGATVMSSQYENHEDAFDSKRFPHLKIVDTTGAGDTFTAAYAISSNLMFA
jgi:sugar/nucleoside kinase (ribokinase family)